MLIGEYSHTMDAKGRVFIPAKFREELGENFIVTRGTEACLFVFSPEAWMEFAGKLQHIPVMDTEAQKFLRLQFASATDCTPDKQGRILLPAELRAYAGLEKDVTIIGNRNHAEIWATEVWNARRAAVTNDQRAEQLRKLHL